MQAFSENSINIEHIIVDIEKNAVVVPRIWGNTFDLKFYRNNQQIQT